MNQIDSGLWQHLEQECNNTPTREVEIESEAERDEKIETAILRFTKDFDLRQRPQIIYNASNPNEFFLVSKEEFYRFSGQNHPESGSQAVIYEMPSQQSVFMQDGQPVSSLGGAPQIIYPFPAQPYMISRAPSTPQPAGGFFASPMPTEFSTRNTATPFLNYGGQPIFSALSPQRTQNIGRELNYSSIAPPAINYSGASPAINYSGASPAKNYSGASPAINYSGASPAKNYSGASPAINYSGAPPVINYSGAPSSGTIVPTLNSRPSYTAFSPPPPAPMLFGGQSALRSRSPPNSMTGIDPRSSSPTPLAGRYGTQAFARSNSPPTVFTPNIRNETLLSSRNQLIPIKSIKTVAEKQPTFGRSSWTLNGSSTSSALQPNVHNQYAKAPSLNASPQTSQFTNQLSMAMTRDASQGRAEHTELRAPLNIIPKWDAYNLAETGRLLEYKSQADKPEQASLLRAVQKKRTERVGVSRVAVPKALKLEGLGDLAKKEAWCCTQKLD